MTDLNKLGEYLQTRFPCNSLAKIEYKQSFWGGDQLVIEYDPSDSNERIEIRPSLYNWDLEYMRGENTVAEIEVLKEANSDSDFHLISTFVNPLIVLKK